MSPDQAAQLAAQINQWRQGDVALGEHSFVFRYNCNAPATDVSSELNGETIYAEEAFPGLVVVTQTCDIVRNMKDRPFVEVSPLVEVAPDAYIQVQKRAKPQFAAIPSLAGQHLVADLDRVMTIEKPVLLEFNRVEGCRNADERRRFAQALARKRARAAFPDEFGKYVSPLRDRFKKIYKKTTEEAKAISAFQEIRVQASPEWAAHKVGVHFWFILDPLADLDRQMTEEWVRKWIRLLGSHDQFTPSHKVVTEHDMSAFEYNHSDQLDFDNIS